MLALLRGDRRSPAARSTRRTSSPARSSRRCSRCVGAAVADRTRRALWQQSVDLAASEQRTALAARGRAQPGRHRARDLACSPTCARRSTGSTACTAAALGCDFSTTYLHRRRSAARWPRRRPTPRERRAAGADPRRAAPARAAAAWRELLQGRTVVINDPDDAALVRPARAAPARRPARGADADHRQGHGRSACSPSTRTQSAAPLRRAARSRCSKAIAAQAAIAIENARLFEGLAARRRATATSSSAPPT